LRDDFSDLVIEGSASNIPLDQAAVLVAISGGGARAARFAAMTLAAIEEAYDPGGCTSDSSTPPEGPTPLMERVRAFSTVSGGSLFASRIAAAMYRQMDAEKDDADSTKWRRCFFRYSANWYATAEWYSARIADQRLGFLASVSYVNPLAVANPFTLLRPFYNLDPWAIFDIFYYPPLLGLLTNRDFIDDLAYGLAASYCGARGWLLGPTCGPEGRRFFQLADFQPRQYPRLFFNATAQQTGRPFVLTQRVVWEPALPGVPQGSSTDQAPHTLEEVGSSPGSFPLAYAAMASAAFPVATQPVELRRYAVEDQTVIRTEDVVKLVDGGVYDNSGLEVLSRFIARAQAFARERQKALRPIVVIAISAEADTFVADFNGKTKQEDITDRFDVGIPIIAALAPVARTIDVLSDNKWRETRAAEAIVASGSPTSIQLVNVHLRDLLYAEPGPVDCQGIEPVFCRCDEAQAKSAEASQIGTDLIMSDSDDQALLEATELLLRCPLAIQKKKQLPIVDEIKLLLRSPHGSAA
jgi:hypothetical protein